MATMATLGLAACSDDRGDDGAASDTGGSDDGGSDDGGADASDGGGSTPTLDAVTISEDLDAEPEVEFETPLSIEQPSGRTVVSGDGPTLDEGDTLVWRSAYVDASTGEVIQSWWQGGPAGGLTLDADSIGQQAFDYLLTATVGSRVALAGWQQDATDGSMRSLIQVADIDRVVDPARAEGEEAPAPEGLPTVTLDDDGAPSIDDVPDGDPPDTTRREVLITGDGEETRDGDWLIMQYTGWTWDGGQQFDSSWDRGEPFGFVLGDGEVINGWDEQLEGVTVGSQLMLVITPEDAYGEDPEAAELGGQTLIFVVDVLDAAPRDDS